MAAATRRCITSKIESFVFVLSESETFQFHKKKKISRCIKNGREGKKRKKISFSPSYLYFKAQKTRKGMIRDRSNAGRLCLSPFLPFWPTGWKDAKVLGLGFNHDFHSPAIHLV